MDWSPLDLIFRPPTTLDIDEVEKLHIECFPITYEKEFFRNACDGKGMISIAAFLPKKCSDGSMEILVGIITASVTKESDCEDPGLLGFSLFERRIVYILTFGVRDTYRRAGIGHMLLHKLLAQVMKIPLCRAIYLHTDVENNAAANFYTTNNFLAMRRIKDFYLIDGQRRDSVLFVHYIHSRSTIASYPFSHA